MKDKIWALLFNDIDRNLFYSTLKKLMMIVFATSFLALIDGIGVFFIPIIIGSFIVYQFDEEKQRLPFITYFLPFFFLFIFFTGGGGFFIINLLNFESVLPSDYLGQIFTGVWSAYIVVLSIWALFKVKIKTIHFVLLTILIPIPYLIGLNGLQEKGSIYFFYFLWNTTISIVLSLMFSQRKTRTTSTSLI